eukprot:9474853-Pyramimonas_sp.AAC.1
MERLRLPKVTSARSLFPWGGDFRPGEPGRAQCLPGGLRRHAARVTTRLRYRICIDGTLVASEEARFNDIALTVQLALIEGAEKRKSGLHM